MKKKPNIILFGIDSLRADHMSLFGYERLTTPHIDEYAAAGTSFSRVTSPSIPTTPGYTSMFTGMDCFSTDVVALRHEGGLGAHVKTLAEILGEQGYTTSCIGFSGNPASRGFQKYLDFSGWGSYDAGRSPKAENLNEVAIPELKRLAGEEKPFFLFLRHMDPHSPYLPPRPFERIFYSGNELDPSNKSLEPVYKFKPFCDYLASWFPPGCTDKDYVIAQYDGAIAYMDTAIANILSQIQQLGLEEDTLIVFDADHGETLYDHDCYFDHHGIYETTLHIPLVFVWPGHVPGGLMIDDQCYMKDITPTILDLVGINPKPRIKFDGHSLSPWMFGQPRLVEPETYITEATWMRKHGWRTPQWKYMHALEPDFHFKPEIELYDMIADPDENHNLAAEQPEVVKMLEERMLAHIARRTKATGRPNPMYTNLNWHGHGGGPFKTSQQAYDTMYIGSPKQASALQAKELRTQRGAKKL
ncbi:MAG TPA: sulfatase [Anaerolineae bacterium]|jgi:arylsulfatase A-like enzyme